MERHEIVLGMPEELAFFRGHFEGHPILAGVVMLNNVVVAESRRAWPDCRASAVSHA